MRMTIGIRMIRTREDDMRTVSRGVRGEAEKSSSASPRLRVKTILERYLRRELQDARTEGAGRETEWARSVLECQLRRNAGSVRDGVVRVAHAVHIAAVEEVECFRDELDAGAGEEADFLRQARVDRELARQPERIAREAGGAVVARVAIVVEVRAGDGGVWLAGLPAGDAADRPASEDGPAESVHVLRIRIETPDAAEDDAVRDIVVAGSPIAVEVERVLRVLRIVGAGNDGGGVRLVVAHFRMRVGEAHLPVVGETLLDVDGKAVVLRIRARLELQDAREVRERPAGVAGEGRVTERCAGRGADNRNADRDRIRNIDVDRARQVGGLHVLVRHRDRDVIRQSAFDAEAPLLHFRILKIRIEGEDGRLRQRDAGRNRAVDVRVRRDERAAEAERLHVDAVVRMRRADHDRGRAAVEDAVAAANDGAAGGVRRPRKPKPRRDVVVVLGDFARVDARRGKLRISIANGWLRDFLEVVAQSGVDRQLRIELPFVVYECGVLGHVRIRDRSGRARTGERLEIAGRFAVLKIGEAVEAVRAEEIAREVVEDLVLIDVESGFDGVAADDVGDRVGDLVASDRRFARAERVTADVDDADRVLVDLRFRIGAVRFARLAVFRVLAANLVEQRVADDRGVRKREGVGLHERVAGMSERVGEVAVLEIAAGEFLAVVAQREMIVREQLVIGLEQEDVLVLRLLVRRRLREDLLISRLRRGIARNLRRGDAEEDRVVDGVALGVVVGEEEMLLLHDRPAEAEAVLIEVIRTLHARRRLDRVDVVVRVVAAVAQKVERGAVELVRARLGNDVDDAPARAAVLGRVGVGVDLELLHGVLRKLVRRAARAGAAERLAEEGVVIVRAVNDERIQCAALAGEADVAEAYVAHDAGRGQREVDEAPAVGRQVLNRSLANHRGHRGAAGIDQRCRGGDGDAFGHALFELEVDGRLRADVDDDRRVLERLESRQLARHGIVAGRQQRDVVVPDRVRHARPRQSGGGVDGGDRDARQNAARVIGHAAGDGTVTALRKRGKRNDGDEQGYREQEANMLRMAHGNSLHEG